MPKRSPRHFLRTQWSRNAPSQENSAVGLYFTDQLPRGEIDLDIDKGLVEGLCPDYPNRSCVT